MKNLQIKKHMMTAISYLIPFVCTAGMLMLIGNIAGGTSVDDFTKQISFPDFLTTLGGTGLGFLPVIICAGVSYSIADKAGIAPGVILGLLCKDAGYGFRTGRNFTGDYQYFHGGAGEYPGTSHQSHASQ